MNIINNFFSLIKSFEGKNMSYKLEAKKCERFLNDIELDNVKDYLRLLISSDIIATLHKSTIDPPVVLPLARYKAYSFELTYWYSMSIAKDVDKNYDPEDIHDHFGFLATKMILGEGYEETIYELVNESKVKPITVHFFKAGMTNIISADCIHSIKYNSIKPSVSLRIFLPNTKGIMNIYSKQSGLKCSEIIAPSDKRRYEFAGLLSAIDKEEFLNEINFLKDDCILEDSKSQLEVLVNI